jgi:hypothetical protein
VSDTKKPVRIFITLEADHGLDVSDVWPDGDAPEVITAEAVRQVMEACGPKSVVLPDWNLGVDVTVSIYDPNTETVGRHESARVWEGSW